MTNLPAPCESPSHESSPADKESSAPIVDDTVVLTPQQGEIPDGGLLAYIQVVGCFLLFMNSW